MERKSRTTSFHKKLNFYLRYECITLFFIFIAYQIAFPALAEPSPLQQIESRLQSEFDNWDDEQYTNWVCTKMSSACKECMETQLGYDVSLVYGHRTNENGEQIGHVWLLVTIDGEPYEFESTTLQFKSISNEYTIDLIEN